jgi:hypothetical protein
MMAVYGKEAVDGFGGPMITLLLLCREYLPLPHALRG